MVLAHEYMQHSTAVHLALWCTLGGIAAVLLTWLTDAQSGALGTDAFVWIFGLAAFGLFIAGIVGIVNLFTS
jgi:hypothetical protein